MTAQPDPRALLTQARMRLWVLADLPQVDQREVVTILWPDWDVAASSAFRCGQGVTRTYLLRHPSNGWALFPVPDWSALPRARDSDAADAAGLEQETLRIALGTTIPRTVFAPSWAALFDEVLDGAGVESWAEVLLDGQAALPGRADLVRLVLDGGTEDDAAAGAVLAALHGFRVRRRH